MKVATVTLDIQQIQRERKKKIKAQNLPIVPRVIKESCYRKFGPLLIL